MTSVEEIISGMEYQTLTAIKGRPNYETVNNIRRKIYDNAASVDLLRSVSHGHLGQGVIPVNYLTVTSTPCNNPSNSGPQPPRSPALFPQQWDDMKAAHKRSFDEFNTSDNFDKSIKPQIIKAAKDPVFLKPIKNHNIIPLQLDANDTMMKEQ
jgi:hypothetical protein